MTSAAATRPRWTPNHNDHLIYDWVKMQGKTQREVSSLLEIHQSPVSRVIQPYERWLAHLKSRENGRRDPQERLRAQRQLTCDRNELILGSCLHIAQDMEGSLDGTRTTLAGPSIAHKSEDVVRTTHFTIDRTGTVCRFLRLAHRINMEQEQLVVRMAKDDVAPANPLTEEDLAEEARQAALDAAELAHCRTFHSHPDATNQDYSSPGSSLVTQPEGPPSAYTDPTPASSADDAPPPPSPTHHSPAPLHNLHNDAPPASTLTPGQACTCVIQLDSQKILHTCITDSHTVGASGHQREALVAEAPESPIDQPSQHDAEPALT